MRKKTMVMAAVLSLLLFAGTSFAAISVDLPGVGSYSGVMNAGSAQIGVGFDASGTLSGAQGRSLGVSEELYWQGARFVGNYIGGGAQGPVALLLNQAAKDFTFTVGMVNAMAAPERLLITVFDDLGRSEEFSHSLSAFSMTGGFEFYQTFTISSSTLASFRKVLFGPNTDANGWSYGGMSYNAAPVPVPAAVWLLGSGLAGLVLVRRRQ
ncbi:MAG: VPLPA-CTERM sorting domain-containing protein [Pseudomonadota bacterium]|nr:VPLPA-CTERM sorting domain-containing protein [Pseudomonadota bacterium]